VKPSLAALGVALLALLLLAVAGPAYQLGILGLPRAFGLMRVGAYVGLIAIAAALVTGWLAQRRRRHRPLAIAGVALVLATIAVLIPYRWQRSAQSAPPIHDISTDLENPPAFRAILALRQNAPNGVDRPPIVNDQQRKGYPDIQPLTLPVPRDEVFEDAIELMQDRDWQIVDADMEAAIIEATDTTPWFGFKDDIVVRLTPWGAGTRVDVRSASRVGLSDVGTNAQRIREFLADLRTAKPS
jgi:uncharacterized protein (DUF1499 family)